MGMDGGVFVLGKPMFGLIITFKFLASSPTAQWCIQQEQMRKNAHRMKSRAAHLPRQLRRSCAQCFAHPTRRFHPGPVAGLPRRRAETYEAKFQFELAESLVDGGVFYPPARQSTPGDVG